MKFTKDEISLCKQVAEKHRKAIKYGDWFYSKKAKLYWVWEKTFTRTDNLDNHFPLWTISECLEFLERRKILDWSIDKDLDKNGKLTGNVCFWWELKSKKFEDNYTLGKTTLEACLRALLAVLEEE